MKICYIIIVVLWAGLAAEAQPPGAYLGSYPLTSKRGLLASNWTELGQADDGSIITRPNGEGLRRIFTTQIRPLFTGSNLNSINATDIALISPDATYFGHRSGVLANRIGDSIHRITFPGLLPFLYAVPTPANQLFLVAKNQKHFTLQYVAKQAIVNIPFPGDADRNPEDSVFAGINFYNQMPVLLVPQRKQKTAVYEFDENKNSLYRIGQLPKVNGLFSNRLYGCDSLTYYTPDGKLMMLQARGTEYPFRNATISMTSSNAELFSGESEKRIRIWKGNKPEYYRLLFDGRAQNWLVDRFYGSLYVSGANGIERYFPFVRQYPKVYNGSNSNASHFLAQTADGVLYAGNYANAFSRITNLGIESLQPAFPFLPGAATLGNTLIAFAEGGNNLLKYSNGKWVPLFRGKISQGFYVTFNRGGSHLLLGLAGDSSFAMAPVATVHAGNPQWTFIGPQQGVQLLNILTLTQDRHGRIYFGRTSQGWGVYDTATGRANTYLMQEGTTSFGAVASLTDSEGRVWLGGRHGLWYRPDTGPGAVKPEEFIRINHPLLANEVSIASMRQWRHYLVVGANKNLLLVDLNTIGAGENPKVLYLNPQELHLTGDCEQNTMLVDKRDSSIWLATSDNVYNINLATWIDLPKYKAEPTVALQTGNDTILGKPGIALSLPPTSNSLRLSIHYQVPDNMPRYIQVALMPRGADSIRWSAITLDHEVAAFNRQNGDYIFHLRVYEPDGSVGEYTFPITIRKFLWQQWWFWLLLSAMVIGISFYLYFLHQQKKLAEANAARIAAEAETLKAEQQRQLTSMQVKSLSTQFRPHFILNALNTIGAQLYDKPEVDAVLGQLGESIGIIFRNAQSGAISHALAQEWRLVESVINIKQMEMNHSVQVHWQVPDALLQDQRIQVPMGMLQIPVENALVHGLRNKETGSKELWIEAQQVDNGILQITIRDNGIGRKAAAAMGNYRSHGVGSRNLQAIIDLLNPINKHPITIQYHDEIFEENGHTIGTEVLIHIPENYTYER